MDGYATHLTFTTLAALGSAELWPNAPILELGSGHYSSPILSAIAKHTKREFISLEDNPLWFCETAKYGTRLVKFHEWTPDTFFGFCLVDAGLSSERVGLIRKIMDSCGLIVLHDFNSVKIRVGFQKVAQEMKIIKEFLGFIPTTGIMTKNDAGAEWISKNFLDKPGQIRPYAPSQVVTKT